MNRIARTLSYSSAIALAVVLGAPSASAQTTASDVERGFDDPNTIVVTARQRQESLFDVPVAVTGISQAQLNRNVVTSLSSVAELAPQVSVTKSPSGAGAVFTIRGIGSPPSDAGLEQSVAVNLDGVQLSRGRIVTQALFDLQQVEVLKGPQALFFGKNSPAGVISITTAGATDTLTGYIRAGYEFEARERFIEAAIAGPITDNLGGRIAVRGSKLRGWIKNVAPAIDNPFTPGFASPGAYDKHTPGDENIAGRVTLEWDGSDGFTATLKASAARTTNDGPSSFGENFCTNGITVPTVLGVVDPIADCEVNGRVSNNPVNAELAETQPYANDGKPYYRQTDILSTLRMTKELGDVSLTSITGFYRIRTTNYDSFGQATFFTNSSSLAETSRNIVQELRLASNFDGPLNFATGVYYEDARRSEQLDVMLVLGGEPVPDRGRYDTSQRYGLTKGRTYSAFGQLRWDVTDTVEVAGGVRYTREKKNGTVTNRFVNVGAAFPLIPEGQVLRPRFRDSNYSPEMTITWRPDRGTTLYAAYKTGYKSGGFAVPSLLSANYDESLLTFGSEKAKGGEIGYKGRLFNDTVQLDVNAYSYTFDNLQVSAFVLPANFVVTNAAKARTRGIEGAAHWQPVRGLNLDLRGAYNKAKYLSFPTAQCYNGQTEAQGCVGGVAQDITGQALPRAPKWGINLGGQYATAAFSDYQVELSAEGIYTSSYLLQGDGDPNARQDGFWRLNAGVRLFQQGGGLEFALLGRNLTNERYFLYSYGKTFGAVGEFTGFGPRPREVLLRVGYKF